MKRLLPVVLLLLLVAAAGCWGLQSAAFDAFLTRHAPAWAWRFGIRLAVERVDFDLWGPSLQVWGLRVAPKDDKWFASARRASVRFNPRASLSGTPHFSIEADAPRVRAVSDLKEKTKFELPNVVLDTVRVSRGAVTFAVPSRTLVVDVPDAEVNWVEGRGWGRLRGGGLSWKGAREPFGEATFEGTRRFGILRLQRFTFASRRLQFAGTGRMGFKHLLEAGVQARLDVRGLPEEWIDAVGLRRYRPIAGILTLGGRVGGRLEEPTFDGSAALSPGRFGPLSFEGASLALGATVDSLRFRRLEARSNAGAARGVEGSLSWKRGVSLDARGQALDYDLRPFMALFVDGYFPVGLRASGTFQARGPLYPKLALQCRLEATGRDLDVTTAEGGAATTWFAMPQGKVSAQCTVGVDDLILGPSRIDAGSIAVAIPSARIDYLKGLKFDTDVRIENLDLVRQYLPEGTDVRGRAVGRFEGPYDRLTFAYGLDLTSTALWGKHLGTLKADATFDLLDLVVRGAVLEGPLGRLEARGKATLRRAGGLDLAVDWSGGDVAVAAGLLRHLSERVPADAAGLASAQGRVAGTLESPIFEGEATVVDARAAGYGLDDASVKGVFGLAHWSAEHLVARGYGAQLEASGEGDQEFFQASGTLRGVTAAGLEPALGRKLPVEGMLSATLRAWGPYRGPTATVEGDLAGAAAQGVILGDVGVKGELQGRRVSARASAFGGAALAQAHVDLDGERPFAVTLEAKEVPWSVLPQRAVPEGLTAASVSGRGSLEGRAGASEGPAITSAQWAGVATGTRAGTLALGEVALRASLADRELRFGLEVWNGEAALEGRAAESGEGPLDLEVRLARLDLARLAGLVAIPRGWVSADGRARLDPRALEGLQGAQRLKALSGLRGRGTVEGLVVPGWAAVPDLTFELENPEGVLRAAVRTPGASVRATLEDLSRLAWTADLALDRFALAPLVPKGHALDGLGGLVVGAARARGVGGEVQEASAQGEALDLAWGPLAPSHWSWSGSLRGQAATFRLTEPRGVAADGTWSPKEGLRVACALEKVPLQGWAKVVPADLQGTATGTADLSWQSAAGLAGRLRLRRLDATLPPVRVENQGELAVSYAQGSVRFDAVHLVGEGFDATLTGSLRPGESWDVKAKGRGDLAALSRGVASVRSAAGSASAEVSVTGPWKAPVVEGPVSILPGARLALDALDQPFEDLDARGYLEASRGLVLEWVDAQFGEGRVHAEGFVGADGFKPKDLRLVVELRDIAYEAPRQVTYSFDSDALLTGTVARPEVRGEVRLKQFLYARRLNWKTMVLDLMNRRPRQVEGVGAEGGVFVDLSLVGSQDLRVENNLGEASLGVDLRARGYLPRPALWGRVDLLDGTLQFRAQKYDVLRSAVEFLGDTQPIPLLDLHARTTASQYTVNVDVTGPLDGYQVLLSSTPPLPQTDLVSLLTLGTTSDKVQAADAVSAAQAASLLTGSMQDLLESEVGDLLGFEQFSIDTSYSPTTQTTMPRVTVGKAITQSLLAKYSAAVGDQSTQDVQLQYTVSPRVQLLGTWADQGPTAKGSVGGEVRFRFTFR